MNSTVKLTPFLEVVKDITSTFSKVKKLDYLNIGKFPIIDQSKNYIAGYTNSNSLINNWNNEEVIVFGDHTRVVKYVDFPIAIGADGVKVLKINSNISNSKYLYYFLKITKIHDAGYSRHYKFLKALKIPILPLSEQQKIASFLTRIEALIQKRKESIQLLDELIKSTFLDMFGNAMRNKNMNNWTVLGKLLVTLTDYHANGSYKILSKNVTLKTEPNYALMVRTTDLESNNFDKNNIYINEFEYNFLSKSKVYGGEIIISKIGSAGNVYLMPFLNQSVSLGMNAFLLRFNDNSNTKFIYHYLKSNFATGIIIGKVKGAVTKTITKDAVRSIKIPKIPKPLQDKFASTVTKIEATKEKYQTSLDELNNLFNSTAQKAFKGELNLGKIAVIAKEISKKEAKMLDEDKILELIQSGSFDVKDYVNEKQSYDDIRDMVLKLMDKGKITQKFTDDKTMILEAIN